MTGFDPATPLQTCEKCGREMAFLATLRQIGEHPSVSVYRCSPCHRIMSVDAEEPGVRRSGLVNGYVGRANVDHYLSLLNGDDLMPHSRGTVTKLLIAEEDRLSRDLEHLDFAERRAAGGRERLNRVRKQREAFAFGTPEREQADRLLVNVESLQTMLDDFCHRLRVRINTQRI